MYITPAHAYHKQVNEQLIKITPMIARGGSLFPALIWNDNNSRITGFCDEQFISKIRIFSEFLLFGNIFIKFIYLRDKMYINEPFEEKGKVVTFVGDKWM